MRSKATNFLQAGVLFSGIIYILIGLVFYLSPITVLKVFAINVSDKETAASKETGGKVGNATDSWVDLINQDELVGSIYHLLRGFSALVFAAGAAMIMPLFDPLKYRGLVYYNGVIFPFFAALVLLKNSIYSLFFQRAPGAEAKLGSIPFYREHLVIFIIGVLLLVVFVLSVSGLLITRKKAREGLE